MRHAMFLSAAFAAIGFAAGAATTAVSAAPLPKVSASAAGPALVEEAATGRRYWRRRGYGSDVVPETVVEGPPVAVVPVLPPPRPLSCGEYRFWNGERCVDARYNPVNVSPK